MTKEEMERLLSEESSPNEPEAIGLPGGTNGPRSIRVVSEGERRRRKEAIASLLISGQNRDRIVELMGRETVSDGKGGTRQGYGMTEAEVDRMIRIVQAEWDEEENERKRYAKATSLRRILREIEEARAAKNYSAIANLEKVLMMIQGTAEPVEVAQPGDNRLTDAVLRLLGESDPVSVRLLIERERRKEFEVPGSRPALPPAEVDSRGTKRKG